MYVFICWQICNYSQNKTRYTNLKLLAGFRWSDFQRQAGTGKLGVFRQGTHTDQGLPIRRKRRVLKNIRTECQPFTSYPMSNLIMLFINLSFNYTHE